jgi:uncharacterized membrane protein
MVRKFLNKATEQGIISTEVQDALLNEWLSQRQSFQKKLTLVTLYTIGVLLVGFGVLSFIASNQTLIQALFGNAMLRFLLVSAWAFGAYWVGVELGYRKKTHTLLGQSLVTLSALLVGGCLFTLGQAFNMSIKTPWLLGLWLLAMLPVMYLYPNRVLTVLNIILSCLWVQMSSVENTLLKNINPSAIMPAYASFMLGFGALNLRYFPEQRNISMEWIRASLVISYLAVFLLLVYQTHFNPIYSYDEHSISLFGGNSSSYFPSLLLMLLPVGVNAMAFTPKFSNGGMFPPVLKNVWPVSLGAITVSYLLAIAHVPHESLILDYITPVATIGLLVWLFRTGIQMNDYGVVRAASLGVFILCLNYYALSWEHFPRTLIFLVGGGLCIVGGLAYERLNKQLKATDAKQPLPHPTAEETQWEGGNTDENT